MAGLRFSAVSGETATGTSAKTILQIAAAANHRAKVQEFSVTFKGTSNTAAPVLVEIVRQTSAGTMTTVTPSRLDIAHTATTQTGASRNATVEPTSHATFPIYKQFLVHPQGGYTWQAPFGQELIVEGGAFLGIRVTAGVDVNCVAEIVFEE